MRKLTEAELNALGQLAQLPEGDREIEMANQFVVLRLGPPLPLIHQILLTP